MIADTQIVLPTARYLRACSTLDALLRMPLLYLTFRSLHFLHSLRVVDWIAFGQRREMPSRCSEHGHRRADSRRADRIVHCSHGYLQYFLPIHLGQLSA